MDVGGSDSEVVQRHLNFVRAQNTGAMSSDYSESAVLRRPDAEYAGRTAIAAYFDTVGDRLGGGNVVFEGPTVGPEGTLVVRWLIEGGPGSGTRGIDTYVVIDGLIAEQTVVLFGSDF